MELAVFLYPLIALTYTVLERNLFAKSSTRRYLKGIAQHGVKGLVLRNPNIFVVPLCFIGSYWLIPAGVYWLVLGLFLHVGALVVMFSRTAKTQVVDVEAVDFSQLCRKRQFQTVVPATIGLLWLLSWTSV